MERQADWEDQPDEWNGKSPALGEEAPEVGGNAKTDHGIVRLRTVLTLCPGLDPLKSVATKD
jgi:hypothetical protein